MRICALRMSASRLPGFAAPCRSSLTTQSLNCPWSKVALASMRTRPASMMPSTPFFRALRNRTVRPPRLGWGLFCTLPTGRRSFRADVRFRDDRRFAREGRSTTGNLTAARRSSERSTFLRMASIVVVLVTTLLTQDGCDVAQPVALLESHHAIGAVPHSSWNFKDWRRRITVADVENYSRSREPFSIRALLHKMPFDSLADRNAAFRLVRCRWIFWENTLSLTIVGANTHISRKIGDTPFHVRPALDNHARTIFKSLS